MPRLLQYTACLLFIFAAVSPPPARADQPAGQVNRVRGAPELHRGAEHLAAVPGMAVLVGDVVVTDDHARLELALADQSIVVVGPASRVSVERFALTAGGRRSDCMLEAVAGVLRAVVSPGGDFNVQARSTVVSVRSTQFTVEAATDRTSVFVAEGAVDVADPAIAGGTARLSYGEGIDILFNPAADQAPVIGPQRWGSPRVARTIDRTRVP